MTGDSGSETPTLSHVAKHSHLAKDFILPFLEIPQNQKTCVQNFLLVKVAVSYSRTEPQIPQQICQFLVNFCGFKKFKEHGRGVAGCIQVLPDTGQHHIFIVHTWKFWMRVASWWSFLFEWLHLGSKWDTFMKSKKRVLDLE